LVGWKCSIVIFWGRIWIHIKLIKLKSSLRKFYGRHHDLVHRYGISVSQITTIYSTYRKHFPVISSFFATRPIRRVPLVEQELLTLSEHLSSPAIFSGVPVTRSLVLCVCFLDRCLSLCTFSFGHCVVCSVIHGL
jgi:hypothetical protein